LAVGKKSANGCKNPMEKIPHRLPCDAAIKLSFALFLLSALRLYIPI
jgi:hypothetical protein